MGFYPLWSGLLLGDLKRYDKHENVKQAHTDIQETRSTNSLVENYFGNLKKDIPKGRRLRPAQFIRKLYLQNKGKLAEIDTILPSNKVITPHRTKRKDLKNDQEQWRPKLGISKKKKSKYFSPPVKFPVPRKGKKLQFEESPDKKSRVEDNLVRDEDSSPQGSVAPTPPHAASDGPAVAIEAPVVQKPPPLGHESPASKPDAFPIFSCDQDLGETRSIEASVNTLLENTPGWGGQKYQPSSDTNL